MKNCVVVPSRPVIRFPIQGMPPLNGWAVRLSVDIEEAEYKAGYWMSRWVENAEGAEFAFEAKLQMVFNQEAGAATVSNRLTEGADLATEVVRIVAGTPAPK